LETEISNWILGFGPEGDGMIENEYTQALFFVLVLGIVIL